MRNNILKGSMIIFMLMLLCMCLLLCVSADNSNSTGDTILTLSKGGIVINYPSNWGYSQATSNDSIMAISKLDSIDSYGVGQVNINIEKRPIEGDFETFLNTTYSAMQANSSFELVSSGGIVFSDKDAVEYIYISNQNGIEREHKAVWFEKGGQAYVLLYSAPLDQFDSNLYVFDFILSDIQIT